LNLFFSLFLSFFFFSFFFFLSRFSRLSILPASILIPRVELGRGEQMVAVHAEVALVAAMLVA